MQSALAALLRVSFVSKAHLAWQGTDWLVATFAPDGPQRERLLALVPIVTNALAPVVEDFTDFVDGATGLVGDAGGAGSGLFDAAASGGIAAVLCGRRWQALVSLVSSIAAGVFYVLAWDFDQTVIRPLELQSRSRHAQYRAAAYKSHDLQIAILHQRLDLAFCFLVVPLTLDVCDFFRVLVYNRDKAVTLAAGPLLRVYLRGCMLAQIMSEGGGQFLPVFAQ